MHRRLLWTMNRPRNRQPRPPRNNNNRTSTPDRRPPHAAQGGATVPTLAQVVPGANVSIVLKADQPTGREVQGIVQDLLTRGNHPRGIKVRLQDGRVGRVQRMADSLPSMQGPTQRPVEQRHSSRFGAPTDVRNDLHHYGEPPARNLADFFPDEPDSPATGPTDGAVTAVCPICGKFEGDEVAVSRHVEEHFS